MNEEINNEIEEEDSLRNVLGRYQWGMSNGVVVNLLGKSNSLLIMNKINPLDNSHSSITTTLTTLFTERTNKKVCFFLKLILPKALFVLNMHRCYSCSLSLATTPRYCILPNYEV